MCEHTGVRSKHVSELTSFVSPAGCPPHLSAASSGLHSGSEEGKEVCVCGRGEGRMGY